MNSTDNKHEFTERFHECERELYAYIFAMVPRHADAMDLLQETTVRLWEHFADFDRSRSFGAWARKFAHTQVLKAHEKGKYRDWMLNAFDEQSLDSLAKVFASHADVLDMRHEALIECLKTLESAEYELLRQQYWNKASVRQLAGAMGLSEHQVHRRLKKIRQLLHKCIDAHVAEQGI